MSRLVTVLLSVKNGAPYVGEAVRSVLMQTFEDWRMVIVDDGSVDGTTEIIEALAGGDERVEILRNSRTIGLGAVLAREVERSATPWIARMDADDVSLPERFALQVEFSRSAEQVHLHGSWAIEIDEQGRRTGLRKVPVRDSDIKRLVWANPFIHPTVWFRRETILRVGNYCPRLTRRQDYDLWFRLVAAGVQVANLPEFLLEYRVRTDHPRRVSWDQVGSQLRVGWSGCARVKAPPYAYLGVAVKALQQLAPAPVRPLMHRVLKRADPRSRG